MEEEDIGPKEIKLYKDDVDRDLESDGKLIKLST